MNRLYEVPSNYVHLSSLWVIIWNVRLHQTMQKIRAHTKRYQKPYHVDDYKTMQDHQGLTNFANVLLVNHKFWPYRTYIEYHRMLRLWHTTTVLSRKGCDFHASNSWERLAWTSVYLIHVTERLSSLLWYMLRSKFQKCRHRVVKVGGYMRLLQWLQWHMLRMHHTHHDTWSIYAFVVSLFQFSLLGWPSNSPLGGGKPAMPILGPAICRKSSSI